MSYSMALGATAAEKLEQLRCTSHGGKWYADSCDYTEECEEQQGKLWTGSALPNGTPICEEPAGPPSGGGPSRAAPSTHPSGTTVWLLPVALGIAAVVWLVRR